MRVLIISGDDDSVCGTRGTELWLTRMGCVLGMVGDGGGLVWWCGVGRVVTDSNQFEPDPNNHNRWKVVTSWRPWHVDGQVAGYKKAFANGVTFMTVHGAGHEVRGRYVCSWMAGGGLDAGKVWFVGLDNAEWCPLYHHSSNL